MNTVRKSIAIAVASLALGGAAIAASNPGTAPAAGGCHWGAFGSHGAGSAERTAKRQAALHDKLGLSTMQEAAWKTFTDKLQALAPAAPAAVQVAATTAPERADRMVTFLQRSRSSTRFFHRNSRRSSTARVTVTIPARVEVGRSRRRKAGTSVRRDRKRPRRNVVTAFAVPHLQYDVMNDRRQQCSRANH